MSKVIQFPLSKDDIPGTNGTEIVLSTRGKFNLIAAKDGKLYGIDNVGFKTFTSSGETYTSTSTNLTNFGELKDSYFDGKHIYALGSKGGFIANTEENKIEETFNSPTNATKIIGKYIDRENTNNQTITPPSSEPDREPFTRRRRWRRNLV